MLYIISAAMDNGSCMAGTRKNSIRIGADDELKLHRECNIIAAQPSTNTLDHDIGAHVSGDSKTATSTSEIMGDIYAVHIGVRENSEMCLSGNVITMLLSTKAPDHDNGNHVSGNSKNRIRHQRDNREFRRSAPSKCSQRFEGTVERYMYG